VAIARKLGLTVRTNRSRRMAVAVTWKMVRRLGLGRRSKDMLASKSGCWGVSRIWVC
jgi:hypothetical protein